MPRLSDRQGHGGLFSINPQLEHNVQQFRGDNLVLGHGSMTELTTSKSSSPSSRPLGSIKLPSIRSLIEDVPVRNMTRLSHPLPERFPVAIPSIAPNVSSVSTLLSSRPKAEPDVLWSHCQRPDCQTQPLSFRPDIHQDNASTIPLSKSGPLKRSGNHTHSRHLSSGQPIGSSFATNALAVDTASPPTQLPLPLLNEPSTPRRTSCAQPNDLPAQQYHQHHIPPKASALNTEQQAEKYVCQQCNKVFSRPSSLKIHGHSHTGEKPFRCPHVDCGKTFSVRSNMKRHEKGCHEA